MYADCGAMRSPMTWGAAGAAAASGLATACWCATSAEATATTAQRPTHGQSTSAAAAATTIAQQQQPHGQSSFAASASATHIILFYKYVQLVDVPGLVASQHALCRRLGLLGRVLLGSEGVNGTLSGPPSSIAEYVRTMQADDRFSGIDWKSSVADPAAGLPFPGVWPLPCSLCRLLHRVLQGAVRCGANQISRSKRFARS